MLRSLPALCATVLSLLLLAHAGLIVAGQWQGDEWFNFSLFRSEGTGFLLHRVLTWSPRPVSEGLVFLYARAVDALHRPLVTPVLGLLFLHNNLHALHHARPGLAWYRLPQTYRQVRSTLLEENGGLVYAGYREVVARFLFHAQDRILHPDLTVRRSV